MAAARHVGTRLLSTAVPAAQAEGAPRLFVNLVVERGFYVFPPEPEWRSSYEARAEAWRAAWRQDYPKAFHDKLDPREAPRATYLAAIERVLTQHEGLPNPHDADEHSLKRHLTRRLYLLARPAVGGPGSGAGEWGFPRAEMSVTDGTVTLRSAILALQRAQLGPQLKALPLSRAPIAHLPSAATPAAKGSSGKEGSSLDVFFKLKHMVGNVRAGDPAEPSHVPWSEYAWLTKEEAIDRLAGQPVAALAGRMLLD